MRKTILLNDSWKWVKGHCVVTEMPSEWENASLPHTFNNIDGQDGGNDYYRGTVTYCRSLPLQSCENAESVYLELNGASQVCDVYLNGESIAHSECGYATFRVQLKNLKAENILCITVNNAENEFIYPQKADFTFYGGIYRDVRLVLTKKTHFELEKDGTPGIKVTPMVDLKAKKAVVHLESWQNGGDFVAFSIGDQSTTVKNENGYASADITIENVHLWNGTTDPYLYRAQAALFLENNIQDQIETTFGCRTIAFDASRGFVLNGQVYPLRGVSRHQDREGIGNALTMKEHIEDMDLILEMGANSIRLAHYQHAQEFYDLCDEKGIVAWAEIPYITEHMPNGRQNTLDQMRTLITQCYNHPCIVCWGLSNEISVHGVSDDLIENHKLLNDLCHEMDKTRPTTMAHAFMLEKDSPLVSLSDVCSYNLYFGWYLGTLEQNDRFFDEFHQKNPNRVMGFSEYGADCNYNLQSSSPEQGDYSEQYQCLYHEYILGCIERHPWLWSTYLWNMFDFAADGRDEGGAHGLNQKGLVSFDRTIKKDAFYLYKAAWNKKDLFVHLCGRRYKERTESETCIKVYSNMDEVSLYKDGKLIETKKGKTIFEFMVPISGTHTISVVSGAFSDSIVVQKVDTPNASYRLSSQSSVKNWFDETDFDSSCFSIRDSLGALMNHPETEKIVGNLMKKLIASRGDVAKSASDNANLQAMLNGMSLESLLKKGGDAVPEDAVKVLNTTLQKIKK